MKADTFKLAVDLGHELAERHQILVTAESCTGGGLASAITDVPGASQWFDCGFVTYSNLSKTRMLAIPDTLIRQYGAVSEAVALSMAKGALDMSNGTLAIATTGIAGPDGGTTEKPVGIVWFGLANRNHAYAVRQLFSGDREVVRRQSIRHAVQMLLTFLRTKQVSF
ncbi:MAG: CinA family protein [Burkholderiaceae bacterium]|jgi:nicotinamide-nucleotide amidase|nr:CinA family protein [Burkholderiaceae bacterium]